MIEPIEIDTFFKKYQQSVEIASISKQYENFVIALSVLAEPIWKQYCELVQQYPHKECFQVFLLLDTNNPKHQTANFLVGLDLDKDEFYDRIVGCAYHLHRQIFDADILQNEIKVLGGITDGIF